MSIHEEHHLLQSDFQPINALTETSQALFEGGPSKIMIGDEGLGHNQSLLDQGCFPPEDSKEDNNNNNNGGQPTIQTTEEDNNSIAALQNKVLLLEQIREVCIFTSNAPFNTSKRFAPYKKVLKVIVQPQIRELASTKEQRRNLHHHQLLPVINSVGLPKYAQPLEKSDSCHRTKEYRVFFQNLANQGYHHNHSSEKSTLLSDKNRRPSVNVDRSRVLRDELRQNSLNEASSFAFGGISVITD